MQANAGNIVVHGVRKAYRNGCRCAICKAWNTAYHREYRGSYVETPEQRRVRQEILRNLGK
jgi:hypothetical protein